MALKFNWIRASPHFEWDSQMPRPLTKQDDRTVCCLLCNFHRETKEFIILEPIIWHLISLLKFQWILGSILLYSIACNCQVLSFVVELNGNTSCRTVEMLFRNVTIESIFKYECCSLMRLLNFDSFLTNALECHIILVCPLSGQLFASEMLFVFLRYCLRKRHLPGKYLRPHCGLNTN